jgi:hypothetical protein
MLDMERLWEVCENYFFLNTMRKATVVNEKGAKGSPAKIAPVASPKESHTPTSPRCAMQLIRIDEPNT